MCINYKYSERGLNHPPPAPPLTVLSLETLSQSHFQPHHRLLSLLSQHSSPMHPSKPPLPPTSQPHHHPKALLPQPSPPYHYLKPPPLQHSQPPYPYNPHYKPLYTIQPSQTPTLTYHTALPHPLKSLP